VMTVGVENYGLRTTSQLRWAADVVKKQALEVSLIGYLRAWFRSIFQRVPRALVSEPTFLKGA
jgi:hypothetical protein